MRRVPRVCIQPLLSIILDRGEDLMTKRFYKVSEWEWSKRQPEEISATSWLDRYQTISIPQRQTRLSAGYDFKAPFNFVLGPDEAITIPTGIKVELEAGQFLMMLPRSGMGFKYFFRLANTVGVIDADYYGNPENEGHIFIKIRNEGNKTLSISKGDGVAQGIILLHDIVDGDSYETGEDRVGGFGSTGK